MNHYHKQAGFTIIETLVAITILMISIVGPLTIAHKGLRAAIDASDQVTASYFAQDAMEFIKNIRDNNILKNRTDWLTAIRECTETKPCKVDTHSGDPSGFADWGVNSCLLGQDCQIYEYEKFSRHFYLVPRVGDLTMTDEAHLIVVVQWKSGVIENEIRYENELFRF